MMRTSSEESSGSAPLISSPDIRMSMGRAIAFHQQGAFAQARDLYQQILSDAPQMLVALKLLGALELQRGEPVQAAQHLSRAAAADPEDWTVLNHLACALRDLEQLPEAMSYATRAMDLAPQQLEIWNTVGTIFVMQGEYSQAMACFDRILASHPNSATAHMNRGVVFYKERELEAALACFAQALELDPRNPAPYVSRGQTQRLQGALAAAIASFDQALAIAPENFLAKFGKARSLLSLGQWEAGWRLYRERNPKWRLTSWNFEQPLWLGEESVAGKTVFLYNDAGLGDGIMMSRLATSVAALGARVILEVHPALKPLLQQLEGVSQVLGTGERRPAFDFHCSLFTLAVAVGLRPDNVPRTTGYLRAPTAKREQWRDRLGPKLRPRVGIVWSGDPRHGDDRLRSLPLDVFSTALPRCCEYISLQDRVRERDHAALASRPWIRSFDGDLHDFSDTAGLCEEMDLILSVDTSVAHLAGALGLPAWTLIYHPAAELWLEGRSDTPWYASMRLYREALEGGWAPVLARVHADLTQFGRDPVSAQAAALRECLPAPVEMP